LRVAIAEQIDEPDSVRAVVDLRRLGDVNAARGEGVVEVGERAQPWSLDNRPQQVGRVAAGCELPADQVTP
jgi:hypothetical protein